MTGVNLKPKAIGYALQDSVLRRAHVSLRPPVSDASLAAVAYVFTVPERERGREREREREIL